MNRCLQDAAAAVRGLLPHWRKAAGAWLPPLCLVASLVHGPVAAQPSAAPTSTTPTGHRLEHEDLESWLDGLLPYAMRRGDVAGAVVVVVSKGQVLLQKGYGQADVATGRAMDPETTLIRPGSVSKLFTWTAVMQLVEQGRIDLDADVNTYLDFRIDPFEGLPVTMRHLLTHTAGFEDFLKDVLVTDPAQAQALPLATFLKRQAPARVYAPGTVPAYSNYGAGLAGYIVQRVSGQAFEDYADQHLFAPLGMAHSTFRQPLPPAMPGTLASGYALASDPALPFEFMPAPMGGATATAADMGRFMLAHLAQGALDGQRILRPATARQMQETATTLINPLLNRMMLGFFEFNRNGRRIIGHDGDTRVFHSQLFLLPDEGVGVFVSFNSVGQDAAARAIRQALSDGFIDRYFPGPKLPVALAADTAKRHAALMAGAYEASYGQHTGPLSLMNLFTQSTVSVDAAGHLAASTILDLAGQPRRFEEVAPWLWQEVGDGATRLAARVSEGEVLMWAQGDAAPHLAHLPVPWWRHAGWLLPALPGALAVLVVTAAQGPLAWARSRRLGVKPPLPGRQARARRWGRIGAGAAAAVMLGWLALLGFMAATFHIQSDVVPWITLLHVLSVAVLPLATALALWRAGMAWTAGSLKPGLWNRAGNALVALACGVLLWVACAFHLIGFSTAF